MRRTKLLVGVGALIIAAILGAWAVYAFTQQASPAAVVPMVAPNTTASGTSTPVVSDKPGIPAPSVHEYGTMTLLLGETVHFPDLTITPLSITEDSRCPLGVMCIQAGTVRVSVRVVAGMGTNIATLTQNQPFTTEAETITLIEVQPMKRQSGTITDKEYRLTFNVQKTDTARCYVGGCSSQLCTDRPDAISTCEYTAAYGCYRTATCERQASGSCGWTQTPALKACLANPPE